MTNPELYDVSLYIKDHERDESIMSVEVPVGEFFNRLDEKFSDYEVDQYTSENPFIRVNYTATKTPNITMAQERIFRNYDKNVLDKLIEFFNQYK